ncbi:MAG: hypothetical protein A2Z20_08690 [Bdellovibrionales bacterium RBG_16_40_8]|nr:MAG: hypothetical protein A2Z20_08690 [Bdellovibrionales bacterium RBG_16_40_8]
MAIIHQTRRYLTVLLIIFLATLLKLFFLRTFGEVSPYTLYILAIFVSALICGLGPGIFASLLTGLLSIYFFIEPIQNLNVEGIKLYQLGLFWVEGMLIAIVTAELMSARHKVKGAKENLEHMINQRTKQLATRSEELASKSAQLTLITNSLPVAIACYDKSLRYIFCNSTFCEWHNKTQGEIIGHTIEELVGKEVYTNFIEKNVNQVLSGQPMMIEFNANHLDKPRSVKVNMIPNYDSDNKIQGAVTLISDVTLYKQAEINARAASEAKGAFLANMSHEIRTPLGAILGFADLMLNDSPTLEKRREWYRILKKNGELLTNIVNDILDLSKIESGKFQVEKSRISLSELVVDLTSLLKLKAEEKGLNFNISADGPTPACLYTDPLRLRQILYNIVGNAIKFTDSGLVDIKIKLLNMKNGRPQLQFAITDTGRGIKDEQKNNLFNQFSQADTSITRKFGGTGLGLILSRHLAHALGGDVELTNSTYGKGSTFTVSIDPGTIELPLEQSFIKKETQVNVDYKKIRLDGLNVLVADDSPDNQLLIAQYLRIAGATVDSAENGQVACDKASEKDYDVILMDLQMPVMDGYKATATLRENGFKKPILALTAHAFKDVRDQCLVSGFSDHLSKPITRKDLLERLAQTSTH